MKMIVVVALALVACVATAPASLEKDSVAEILRADNNQNPDGSFQYGYATNNGITQEAAGELKPSVDEDNKPRNVVVIRGSYSYTDPQGEPISITYFADETGFHAEGKAIPKAPARR